MSIAFQGRMSFFYKTPAQRIAYVCFHDWSKQIIKGNNTMKNTLASLIITILFLAFFGCKKDDEPQPGVVTAACRLLKETARDGNYLVYSYDNDGNPTKIETFNPYIMTHKLDVFNDKITLSEVNKLHPYTFTTNYGVGLLTKLPDLAVISVTMDDSTQVNWKSYFFQYDSKGRLVSVGEETENIPNDDEWELLISYNDQDNVIKMVYQLTTSASNLSTVIMVDGHDTMSTPYSGIKAYKFLMSNWDNSDSGRIISALSKNNPTSFRLIVNEVQTMNVFMQYEYNDQGFPVNRVITNKNDAGEYQYTQVYEYACP
jgi:YD repeat-containing protein